jgi:hypothetical protein
LDGRGNDFDQAALLVALLRQAGYTASYVYGTIELNQTQVDAWLGTDASNACNAGRLLTQGGIPVSTATSDGTCNGTFGHIDIAHVWVSVTGGSFGSSTYVYDPSYKAYTTPTGGIALASAMGYSQSTFLSDAESGSTITSYSIQNVSRTNLQNDLQGYANNTRRRRPSTMLLAANISNPSPSPIPRRPAFPTRNRVTRR